MTNDYLTNLLKDLGANNTPSQSINLTSGKDNGQIDVTRKDTLTASAPGQEKVTMYHPSGSTIQVYPYEVSLFENNGYSTQPPQPQQPVQQPVTPVQQPVQQPVTPVQQPVQQPVDQGVGMPNQQTTPQTYTVEMDSPEDLELQDDPNYNEVVNDDGTVTYTSNIDTGTVTPQVPTGVGTYASDVVTPTPVVAPVVAPGVNPRTNREPGMVPVEDQTIPGVNPIGNTNPGVADPVLLPNTDAGGGNLNQNPLGGQSGIDAADARETELIGTPWAPTGDFEEADEDGTYASDNPVGIHGNKKFIQDESGEWISNPAYTHQEMIASDDSLETADAVAEAAITEFESDSNINNEDDAITNFTTIADLTEDGEGVDAAVQTDDALTEIELDPSTTPEEKKTLAGGLLDGLKGLFKDGELAKAAMLYFGSRIAGFSHSGSAKFAYESTDLFGDKAGTGLDANYSTTSTPVMMQNGRLANYDTANNRYVYLDDGSVVAGETVNQGFLTARDTKDTQRVNKERSEQANTLDTTSDGIQQAITITEDADFNWETGFAGTVTNMFKNAFGYQDDVSIARNIQQGVNISIALTRKPPGAISNEEMKMLLGAVPDKNTNPQAYIQWAKAVLKFNKAQAHKLRWINNYMSQNSYATELHATEAYDKWNNGGNSGGGSEGSGGSTTIDPDKY